MKLPLRLLLLCMVLMISGLVQGVAFAQDDVMALEERVATLFERSCTAAGCHAGMASKEMPTHKIIDPGHPESSYLIKKVKGEPGIIGLQMPMTGDKLTDAEIATIEQWITKLGDVADAAPRAPAVKKAYPFYGWKVINLPSSRTLEAGNLLFLIGHRFNPKISDGYDAFFGLDGSGIIYLSLGYAITDNFLVALGRSNSSDDVELQARYGIFEQGVNNLPIGVSVQTSFNFITQKSPNLDSFASERFKATLQVSLTRQIGETVGLAVVPGILLNQAEELDDEEAQFTVGLGGRWRFTPQLSIIGEWVPIVSGFNRALVFGNDVRFDSWGGGLEIATAGHVFQIIVTNSVGLTSDQYLRGGDLDLFEGDMRLGFNIFRVLN